MQSNLNLLARVFVVAAVCFGKKRIIACVLRDRRRKGRENREGIGDRKKGTNNNNG